MEEQNQGKDTKIPSFASFEDLLETEGSDENAGVYRFHDIVLSLALKLLGLYLLYLAFESLTTIFASLYLIQANNSILDNVGYREPEFNPLKLQITQAFGNFLVAPLVKAILYGASGFYLASNGSLLYRLLTLKRLVKK